MCVCVCRLTHRYVREIHHIRRIIGTSMLVFARKSVLFVRLTVAFFVRMSFCQRRFSWCGFTCGFTIMMMIKFFFLRSNGMYVFRCHVLHYPTHTHTHTWLHIHKYCTLKNTNVFTSIISDWPFFGATVY